MFTGEGITSKNTRHCVNSIALDFIPSATESGQVAYFAGGCFWGVEHFMKEIGLTRVGYMGGAVVDPTYEEVCTGQTGHFEAIEVVFNGSFEQVAKLFFEIHDPTQSAGQGPDLGPQYRSAIFYVTDEQKAVAQSLLDHLGSHGCKCATQLLPASKFYPAEDHHQDYYTKTGKKPYCYRRMPRF